MDAFGIENHGYSPLISQKYVVKGDFEVYDGMDLLHHAMLNTCLLYTSPSPRD